MFFDATVAAIKREPSLKLNISVIGRPNCIIFSVSIDTIEMQLFTKKSARSDENCLSGTGI